MKKRKSIEIVYSPTTRVVVHEVQHMPREQLLFSMGHGVEAGNIGRGLNWIDGIAFAYGVLPLDDYKVVDQYLRGTVHFASLVFTEWPEFVPFVELQNSKVRIPLWKTDLPSLVLLVKWLKRGKH